MTEKGDDAAAAAAGGAGAGGGGAPEVVPSAAATSEESGCPSVGSSSSGGFGVGAGAAERCHMVMPGSKSISSSLEKMGTLSTSSSRNSSKSPLDTIMGERGVRQLNLNLLLVLKWEEQLKQQPV